MFQNHLDALVSAWNTGDLDGLDNFLSPNTKRTGPGALNSNADNLTELKKVITDFRTAFPDSRVTIKEAFFLENMSICTWNFTGTNTGPGDFPPTGKKVDIHGASIARYENGKQTSEEVYFDALEFLSQVGIIEMPKAASA